MKIYTKTTQIKSLVEKEELIEEAQEVEKIYPFKVTEYFLSLCKRKNLSDPLFVQIFPQRAELEEGEEDPFGEEGSTEHPHLIRRYKNRLLVAATNLCLSHCRFCMRKRRWREKPYFFTDLKALEGFLRNHPEINDVLISGGDPFCLDNDLLNEILALIKSFPQIRVVRIGTRALSFAPWIAQEKAEILKKHSPVWVNVHFNHPLEITKEAEKAIASLLKAGCPVNNQAVLLKGVNDDFNTLKELCLRLAEAGVRSYYLFSCDPVRGTSHFRVNHEKGVELVRRLLAEISPLFVPRFAVDSKDGKKILI